MSRRLHSRLNLESLENREVPASPVLMVLANQDFWYRDYSDPRLALEQAGFDVKVASATMSACVPQAGSGGEQVVPDLTLSEAEAADYSAIVFVGGWGASAYQPAFTGTYAKASYNGSSTVHEDVNRLINEFVDQDKYITALCHGVSVLAWARVDGQSLLDGKVVTGWEGAAAYAPGTGNTTRWHVETNGATMLAPGSVGNACTDADDVWVDGKIITGQNFNSATQFGEVLAQKLIEVPPTPVGQPKPVLMVIANRDFYYQEYGDTRAALEMAGVQVVVGAATRTLATPHQNTGEPANFSGLMPDVTLEESSASDYSAIVFVGGWGASSYQYAFEGTYGNAVYNGAPAVESAANRLINEFIAEDKYVAALCHGVSALAWARVDGVSPIAGKTVSAWANAAPMWYDASGHISDPVEQTTRWHVELNGATMVQHGAIGDPLTDADDVIVDGRIITAENYNSATLFGQTIASRLFS